MVRASSPGLWRAAVLLAALVLATVALVSATAQAQQTGPTVFINEINYDDTGTDANEFIEVAGAAGTDLSGYQLVLYNGAATSRAPYDTRDLTSTIPDQANGFGTVVVNYPSNGIQNGEPDGVALVRNGTAVEFLSYEGSFTAASGPAQGRASRNIGTDPGAAPADNPDSLQRQTTGSTAADTDTFTLLPATKGQPNAGQTGTPPQPVDPTLIREIQGTEQRSPLEGDRVTDVPGTITAFRDFGFFMQDPTFDNDDATSEGIFVFTGSNSEPAENGFTRGQPVVVDGTVTEFRPGPNDGDNLTDTQITSSIPEVTAAPAPAGPDAPTAAVAPTQITLTDGTVEGDAVREPPTEVIDDDSRTTRDIEQQNDFQENQDGIDFYESLEGMFVQVNDAVAVGPSDRRGFGEIPTLPEDGNGATGTRTIRDGIRINLGPDPSTTLDDDFNPERVIFDDEVLKDDVDFDDTPSDPTAPRTPLEATDTGETFAQPLQGVINYSFGNFKAQLVQNPEAQETEPPREVTDADGPSELSIATYSLENLSPEQDETTFDGAADRIVNNMRSPDLIGLTEVQDNDGDQNSQQTDADLTAQGLINAIEREGGPEYQYRDIDPVDDQDGGEPGGNIRVAFLFREDQGLKFVDRPGGTPTTDTTVTGGPDGPRLSASPGRVDPEDPAFEDSRKPLAGEFTYNGRELIVVQNHFVSKGEDDALFGRFQPPKLTSEEQRIRQAEAVNGFVDEVLAEDPNASVAVMGDLNDFERSRPVETLEGDGDLFDLVDTVPEAERYSFVFDGNSQVLDHVLVSDGLQAANGPAAANAAVMAAAVRGVEYDMIHAAADYGGRESDHDPTVARFDIPKDDEPEPPTPGNRKPVANNDAATTREDRPVRIAVLRNDRDPDGDTLRIQRFTRPDDGSVRRTSGNTLTYDPNRNFSGRDSFTYTVSDGGGGTDTATVTIRVQPDRSDDGNNNGGGGNGSGGNGNNNGCNTGNGGAQAGGGASANNGCAQAGPTTARR